jgi:hypothetical protein
MTPRRRPADSAVGILPHVLRDARRSRDQEWLGQQLGVSRSTVQRWERNGAPVLVGFALVGWHASAGRLAAAGEVLEALSQNGVLDRAPIGHHFGAADRGTW